MPRRRRFVVAALGVAALLALVACAPVPPPPPPPSGSLTGATYTGLGFDACTAPSAATMTAWLNSPYREVGVYLGGASRACSQANLTPTWVNNIEAQGWRILPIWVGPQAPAGCTGASFSHRISSDPNTASSEAAQEAGAAVTAANALGMGTGSPIYYDMEAYTRNSTCSGAVRAFVSSWVSTLHSYGYKAGYYSSAASGIADQVDNVTQGLPYQVLDQIWFAHWNGNSSVYGSPYIPDAYWSNHQRHHQYHGGQNETYGGVTINIDGNGADGLAVAPTG